MPYDVAIIGAGTAGLAAAKALASRGLRFVVLEASHRIGGRAYTEEVAPGVPFDLGAHFLHAASINPMRQIAEEFGFHYRRGLPPRHIHLGDRWASDEERRERDAFFAGALEAIGDAGRAGRDVSLADITARDSRWTGLFDYMASIWSSRDSDQISTLDLHRYTDTDEDWPVREGYGALIARWGADVPIELNSAVRTLDWSGRDLRLETARGTVTARSAIVTVSTGVLAADDIRFTPSLPDWKRAAVHGVPLGVHNRICLPLERNPFGEDTPELFTALAEEDVPMAFWIRPFGYDYVVAITGGRFAAWLEHAGVEASADYALQRLKGVFGNDVVRHIGRPIVTAWGGDPWTRGAYSVAEPGQADRRAALARPLDDRVYFAGEATSRTFFSTVHGAYRSGCETAAAVADALAGSRLRSESS